MNIQGIALRLHDRATRGELLSAEERAVLDDWYAQQDAEEMDQLAEAAPPEDNAFLHERIKDTLARMAVFTEKMQEMLVENKQLLEEIAILCQQSLDPEIADIRQAYPLMDAVARQEGWDDPEMDSYDIYARKPQQ